MGVAKDLHLHSFRPDRRMLLCGALAVGVAAAAAHASASGPAPSVLFICQFGSVKSAIARELFRDRAMARGVPVRLISRGITPERHASARLLKQLQIDHIDPDRQPLTRLDGADLGSADIVVLFDRLPPELARPDARDWTEMPSMNDRYTAARAFLDPRLDRLLDEIARRPC